MATVTGYTAERMKQIEDETVVNGYISGDDLVLVTREGVEINAGDVRGPTGPQGPNADVGDIKASIRSSIPGWLLMGTSVPNADTTYPDLWGFAPASWKSGSTLNLPSMTDNILQGGGTTGAVTGSNTKTLTAANLPPHVHSTTQHVHGMTHTHTMAHTHEHPHTHSINHDHPNYVTGASEGAHLHQVRFLSVYNPGSGAAYNALVAWTNPTVSGTTTVRNPADGEHQHNVNLPPYSGTSGSPSDATTEGSSAENTGGPSATNTSLGGGEDTGSGPGTSTPFDVQQRALRVNFFIKT